MDISSLIEFCSTKVGLTEEQLGITLLFIMLISNSISRLIPDNSTVFLLFVKKLTGLIGLYVSNRIAPGMTVNDIAKSVVSNEPPKAEVEPAAAEALYMPSALQLVKPANNPFRRGPDGRFVAIKDKETD